MKNRNVKAMSAVDMLNDPEYQIVRKRLDEERERKSKSLTQNELPLLVDLRKAGIDIDSVWDLVQTKNDYKDAVPVLMEHITRPYYTRIQEGIARALATEEAYPYWNTLMDMYRTTPAEPEFLPEELDLPRGNLKIGLALALSSLATVRDFDDVVSVLLNPDMGPSRIDFVFSVARSGHPETLDVLNGLVGDPYLGKEVVRYLKKLTKLRPTKISRIAFK